MALSRVVSDIFHMEKYRDLEIPLKSQSRLLKVVPFDRSGLVSYFQPYLKGVALKNSYYRLVTMFYYHLSLYYHASCHVY